MEVNYQVVPLMEAPAKLVFKYFDSLIRDDILKYRLADLENPDAGSYRRLIGVHKHNMYVVTKEVTKEERSELSLIGEFTLVAGEGKTAQIHFSAISYLTLKEKVHLAKYITDSVLSWTRVDKPHEYLYTALLGYTPLSNREACLFVLKTGFKKLAIVPGGAYHLGKIDDAMFSMKHI